MRLIQTIVSPNCGSPISPLPCTHPHRPLRPLTPMDSPTSTPSPQWTHPHRPLHPNGLTHIDPFTPMDSPTSTPSPPSSFACIDSCSFFSCARLLPLNISPTSLTTDGLIPDLRSPTLSVQYSIHNVITYGNKTVRDGRHSLAMLSVQHSIHFL